jgi:5-methyltetrahydrofolate--homocysteine methyltransferase
MTNEIICNIFQAILEGNAQETERQIHLALNSNIESTAILNEGMIAAMQEVGRRFESGDYYIPEMLISANAMKLGLSVLKPYLLQTNFKSVGLIVAGSVKGDLHDIGKNLVCTMLEGGGFEVVDLGTDVTPKQFVDAVQNHSPQIVALSSLLTTTMPSMNETIMALEEANLRDKVRIIIGGAPVTNEYAVGIGADGYAPDASRAVALAQKLIIKNPV